MKMTNMNARDISAEQTLLVSPSPFKRGTHIAQPQMTSIAASPLVQSSGGVQSLAGDPPPIPVATQIPALPIMQPAVLSNQQYVSSQGRQNLVLFSVKLGKRVVLFLICILVILIGITIALLSTTSMMVQYCCHNLFIILSPSTLDRQIATLAPFIPRAIIIG